MNVVKLFVVAFILLATPTLSHAQLGSGLLGENIGITFTPAIPEPGDVVTASFRGYQQNFYGHSLQWLVNGFEQTANKNKTSIQVAAKMIGEPTSVTVQVLDEGSVIAEYSNTFYPVRVDIIFEPLTYTPRWYKGAALPTIDSTTRIRAVVTLPDQLPTNELLYRWRINEQVIGGGDSINGTSVEVPVPRRSNSKVRLEVTTPEGELVAQKSVLFPIAEPELLFYTVSPLLGRSSQTIKNDLIISATEEMVRAVPYNLSLKTINSSPLVEWQSNGKKINTNNSLDVAIANPDNKTQSVSLRIQDLSRLSQGVWGGFQVRN